MCARPAYCFTMWSNSIWNRQIRLEIVKFDLKSPNSIWYCTEILMALWFYKVSFLKKLNNANLIIKIPKFKWNFKKVFNPLCVWYEEDGCRRPAGRQISLNYFSTYAQWEFGVTSFQFGWIQLILVMFGTSPNLRTNNLGNHKFPLS